MILTDKFSDLFIDYVQKKEYYNNSQSLLVMIREGAYDFLTDNCGPLYNKITSDFNLNESLMNIFAQTFVKHFWNNRIGYDNADSFYIKLSAFFEENLPLWAQFFNEAIINSGAMLDSINSSNTTSDSSGDSESHTTGNNSNDTNTNSSTDTTVNGGSTTESTNDSTINGDTTTTTSNKTNNASVSASGLADSKTTTPQTPIPLPIGSFSTSLNPKNPDNENLGDTDDFGNSVDPVFPPSNLSEDYDNYADEVNFNASRNKDIGYSNSNNEVKGTNKSTTNGSNKTTVTNNSTNNVSGNTTSKITGKNNTDTYGNNSNTNKTSNYSKARNSNVASLAQSLNRLANGAYSGLFRKCKRAGLFLGIY